MTFADLVAGDAVFLDANTLVYHFVADPTWGSACSQLLQRIENQEIQGVTSTGLLSNDALIVAIMQANGLTKLASSDQDFDHVPGLTRFEPV